MDINRKRSYWVIFIKGVISSAKFFAHFKNFEEFDKYVIVFYSQNLTRAALLIILSKEIYGLGFATACDFSKENGYPKRARGSFYLSNIKVKTSKQDFLDLFKNS
jgi:hypothetical protein